MRDAPARSVIIDLSYCQVLLSLLPPEARLLFIAANELLKDSAVLELVQSDLDWVEVCRIAEREKALPLLWRRIENVAAGNIPTEAEAHVRRLARVISFHMSYLEQLVMDSTRSLDRAGVDYVLLKGAALSCAAYGSFRERPMTDVDLLVREHQANAAVTALLSAGWVAQAENVRTGDFSQHHHLPPLVDPYGLVSAEIHTSLFPRTTPFGITTDSVLDSAQIVSFRDSSVRVPAPLYMLLHACIHFAWSHLFRYGAWRTFRDIQTMVKSYDLDWRRFVELARVHRAGTCCFWTLYLARQLIGARVPDEVLAALRPPLPAVVIRTLERHFTLILVPSSTACPSVSLRRAMWSCGILPRHSGHASSRPWAAFALRIPKQPDQPMADGRWNAQGLPDSSRSGNRWVRYWASVLLAAPAPR